jgi:hypothetical protein
VALLLGLGNSCHFSHVFFFRFSGLNCEFWEAMGRIGTMTTHVYCCWEIMDVNGTYFHNCCYVS